MRSFRSLAALLFVLILAGAAVAEVPEIRDLGSVAPGTRGVCVTEMPGGELTKIPLTVLAYQAGATPGGDMFLVRLDDPRFEATGILAGMSGSPVYIDGRLLGALAFAWQFAKAPVAGVTPFIRMMSLGKGTGGASRPGTSPPGRPAFVGLVEAWNEGTLGRSVLDWLLPGSAPKDRSRVLAVSLGAGPADGWLAGAWKRLGWATTGAAARSSGDDPLPMPRPGGMIAAVLVDGDATVAAGGTVTEVRGRQVWAFGHPFLGTGRVRLPLARARVTALLPSLASSFKFFAVGREAGALEADRSRGIWGRLGAVAPMLPVHIRVDGRRYEVRIVPDRTLLPLLAAYVTQTSITAGGRSLGEQTLHLDIGLDYGPGGRASFRESFVRPDAPAQAAALAAAVLGYMEGSPFPAPPLKGLEISVRTEEAVRKITIVEATPDRRIVRPGQLLRVHLRLRRFGRGDTWRTEEIRIPADAKAGAVDLVVGDGDAWTLYDLGARPFRPASFEDDLRLLGRYLPASTMVLALERRDVGVVLDGGAVAVPPSVALYLEAGRGGEVKNVSYRVMARRVIDLGEPVSGGFRVRLRIRTDGMVSGEGEGS